METQAYKQLMVLWDNSPRATDAELANLLSTGAELPRLLSESEEQGREALDELLCHRHRNGVWLELTPISKLILQERFEFAFAVMEAMAACRLALPDGFDPIALLIEGWADVGSELGKNDLLRKYLPELLTNVANGNCIGGQQAGG